MSSNQLAAETSPYLLLHKDNPVHWRAWSQEALDEAAAQNKPILLSIGYTACHWCHVMNHESFTDPETAAVMNEHFINIKVDREERPDLDQIYQTAAQALGNNGGWPLTAFLTPQGEPYFVGTYFPKDDRLGQPPFKRVLEETSKFYREQTGPLAEMTSRVQQVYAQLWARDTRGQLNGAIIDDAAISAGRRFDIFFGGMIGAPKFPQTGLIELLWRGYMRIGAEQFNEIVNRTLFSMTLGGIYDHVGGGFHRYAVDEKWRVPHFEKMLYDNAQIVDVLTLVWQHNRMPLYQRRVEETIGWVLREMMVEDQAFASSMDADSDGEEGKYYVWSEAEIDAALMGTFAQGFKNVYSVTATGNWEGHNILNRLGPQGGYPRTEADEAMIKRQLALLLAARSKRNAPMRDDKVLADWNGLMISALANAGAVFRNGAWITAAVRAFDFVERALGEGDRLYHSWRAGKRGKTGFADDYAHMARAAMTLYQVTGDKRYLSRSQAWVAVLNDHFWDIQNGGYFYTADDSDPLIVRSRMIFDQIIPSANGVMVSLLCRLYLTTGDNTYRNRNNGLIEAFGGEVARAYISMPSYLNGLETVMTSMQIVIVGPVTNPKTHELVAAVLGRSLPNLTLQVIDPQAKLPEGHPAAGKGMQNAMPTAYLCQHTTCSQPITNPVALSQILLPARAAAGQA